MEPPATTMNGFPSVPTPNGSMPPESVNGSKIESPAVPESAPSASISNGSPAVPDAAASASPQAGPSIRRSARQSAPMYTVQQAASPAFTPKAPKKSSNKASQQVVVDDSKMCFGLPEASHEELHSFVRLETCTYQNRNIGLARTQEDNFTCECRFDPAAVSQDPAYHACGEESGCINRLTQVECDASTCRTQHLCQNQRIQRAQNAPVKIIKTEKKGCGMMAAADLPPDQLVSEYIGEVIGHSNFVRRLRDYGEEGIKHFYFMALQKDEYIDATKKGGIGRFLNHSCAPNCYVAKWVVGNRLRMAIFTKRPIRYGEELTFNYNVDRYGHDAQECFCGEEGCVGFIGGKTQTDIGIMDDLFLDALGIADEVEELQLKGSKKKKSFKLDEDYTPTMREMTVEEVPTVASAVRQAINNKRILTKLLARIVLSEDTKVQGQLMRLRGFSLMTMVLDEYGEDWQDVVIPVLKIFLKWPLMAKNKVANSNAEELVNKVITNAPKEEEEATSLAHQLLAIWNSLEFSYRIPVNKDTSIGDDERKKRDELLNNFHNFKRPAVESTAATGNGFEPAPPSFTAAPPTKVVFKAQLPKGWSAATDSSNNKTYYFHHASRTTRWTMPSEAEAINIDEAHKREQERKAAQSKSRSLQEIMSGITAAEEQRKKRQEEDAAAMQAANEALNVNVSGAVAKPLSLHKSSKKRKASDSHGSSSSSKKKSSSSKRPGKSKEEQVLKLFTPVVIKVLTKYIGKALDRDQFKKRAKELSHLLVEKERKSSRFDSEDYSTLAADKEKKLRAYCKDWTAKLIARKGLKPGKPSQSQSPSKSTASTPATTAGSSSKDNKEDDEDDAAEREMQELMAEMNRVDGEAAADDIEEEDEEEEEQEQEGGSTTPAGDPDDPSTWVSLEDQLAQLSEAHPPPPPPELVDIAGEAPMDQAEADATLTLEEADLAVEATRNAKQDIASVMVLENNNDKQPDQNGRDQMMEVDDPAPVTVVPAVPAPVPEQP